MVGKSALASSPCLSGASSLGNYDEDGSDKPSFGHFAIQSVNELAVNAEVQQCLEAHGITPMQLLLDNIAVDKRTTAVHCNHTKPELLSRFAAAGGSVCVCPLTEGNLASTPPQRRRRLLVLFSDYTQSQP